MQKYPYQNLPGLNNVEVEGGETIVLADGKSYKFVGRKHSQGGINVSVPNGAIILSEKLKLPKEVVKEITDTSRKASPASLSKKYDTNSYAEKLNRTDDRYDELDKKTQELMLLKNKMMQQTIFNAQENFKNETKTDSGKTTKRGTNSNSRTNTDRDNSNGDLTYAQDGLFYDGLNPYLTGNQPVIPTYDQSLYSKLPTNNIGDPQILLENLGARLPAVQNDLLYPNRVNQNYTAKDIEDYKNYQRFLTGDKSVYDQYGLDYSKAEGVKRLTAINWLQNQNTPTPDKNVKVKGLVNGKWQPLTKDNFNSASDYRFDGFVDGLPGNGRKSVDFARTSNQPNIYYEYKDEGMPGVSIDYGKQIKPETPLLPSKELIPLKNTPKTPVFNKFSKPTPEPESPSAKKGPDWQEIINGVELGLNAIQLANIKVKNPYYQYQPSQLYYTRFEPVNTKQQERAFNLGKTTIENSNLPEIVKKARIADMYAKTVEGVNQIDLTNAQGNLANKNQNVQYAREVMNNDVVRRNQANYAYVQEQDKGQENAYNLRQKILGNSLGVWREHIKNREEVELVNQQFRNYKYEQKGNSVNYVPGRGNILDFNQLSGYRTPNRNSLGLPAGFDINDLSASGREKLLNQ